MTERCAVIRIAMPEGEAAAYTQDLIRSIIMTLNDNNQTADLYYEDVP